MKLVLAGVSGFLGTAWRDHLAREGHEVVRLVRGEALSASESSWDPYAGQVDRAVIEYGRRGRAPCPALRSRTGRGRSPTSAPSPRAGSRPPAPWPRPSPPRTASRRSSRRTASPGTATGATRRSPRRRRSTPTRSWAGSPGPGRTPPSPAAEAGARVAVMRSSIILDKRGGALKPLLLLFKAGLGGPVGPGTQYFSTISMPDWVRAATHLATDDDAAGVYNVSAPNATTNAEFGKQLGRMLHRPSCPAGAVVADQEARRRRLVGAAQLHPGRAGQAAGRGLHLRAPDPQRAARGSAHLTGPHRRHPPGAVRAPRAASPRAGRAGHGATATRRSPSRRRPPRPAGP